MAHSDTDKDRDLPQDGAPGTDGTPPDLSDDALPEEPPRKPLDTPPPVTGSARETERVYVQQPRSFLGILLGGAAAAAIWIGAAQYLQGGWPFGTADDGSAAAMEERLAAAEAAAAQAQAAAAEALTTGDLAALQDGQTALRADLAALTERLDAASGDFSTLNARLDELERRPISEGVSEEAIAVYERELETLREAIAQQRTEVEAMTQEAAAMEASAEETARMTMARAALSRVRAAVDSGEPFTAPLQDIREAGVEPPAILTDVADDGVITRDALQARFPEAARAALRAWRGENASSESGGGLTNFLADQLGARSVTPRDGADPDAVLSRAEAAVRDGRLADALAEIKTLPDSARAALDAWEGDARRRMDVRAAVDALAQSLNEG